MADKIHEYHVDFIEWCAEQRDNALKSIELLDSDDFNHATQLVGDPLRDKSPELRATYERIYLQMDDLIKRYRRKKG